MFHPKWFNSEHDVKVGVILFLKNEGSLNNTYQYGTIKDVEFSKDGKIRRVTIKSQLENTNQETQRAVRNIVMIHPVDETCIKNLAKWRRKRLWCIVYHQDLDFSQLVRGSLV